jgi:Mlc titration factor MtfA (ptsG expression regulator)
MQVGFGLEPLLLIHFTRILIYPDRYRIPHQTRDHIGEVNPGLKVIAISWKHFLAGFGEPTNAHNVGLHEMAHALWFENVIPNAEDDLLEASALHEWRALAKEEYDRISRGESRLFRAYAATDQAEFFAVAVEYFFEQPIAYREKMPDLYACMVKLLKQDPAAAPPPDAGPVPA